jgi:hypothetical protein
MRSLPNFPDSASVATGSVLSNYLRVHPSGSLESPVARTIESFAKLFGCWDDFLLISLVICAALAHTAVLPPCTVLANSKVLRDCSDSLPHQDGCFPVAVDKFLALAHSAVLPLRSVLANR